MVENRPFTLANLELVNRIEWNGQRLLLRTVGPQSSDDAAVVWPGGNERTFTLGEVLVAVEFIKTIADAEFTMLIEDGKLVWYYRFEPDEK